MSMELCINKSKMKNYCVKENSLYVARQLHVFIIGIFICFLISCKSADCGCPMAMEESQKMVRNYDFVGSETPIKVQ